MRKPILILLILVSCLLSVATAQVHTTQTTDGFAECVYLAGNADDFPFEFYDAESRTYRGIIPDLLAILSEKSGVDFVYINGNGADRALLAENLQVDAISARNGAGAEYLELIRCQTDGESVSVGLSFTSIADADAVAQIKAASNALSQSEKNGILLRYTEQTRSISIIWILLGIALILLLVGTCIYFPIRIKRIQARYDIDKLRDSETGIGNLHYFRHHFRYTINDISRNLYYIVYIILDSSYLRSYHGDSSFDEMLQGTAAVLNEHAGEGEFAARITENGFAMAIQCTNDEEAARRAEKLLSKLNDLGDHKERSRALIFHGALYHLASTDKNCEILLFNLRKNCSEIFGSEKQLVLCDVHSMNRIREEKKITESILSGFEKNEFKMYLQFIVDKQSKKIVSAEALSRWDSREKGLLGPGKDIANMESAGLISHHDFYMFELVCRQLQEWHETEYRDLSISCNFTRITLSEANFIEKITMIANAYRFDRKKLAIEITEDAMEKNRETATQNVRKCKELGFSVYLDDLGSGYTSLANLCDYPIDVVKIDRDILLKTDTPRGKDLFSGIVALAHSLNIKVICEGVETAEQNELVSASECDFIQGWFYSKALPTEECETFIRNYRTK